MAFDGDGGGWGEVLELSNGYGIDPDQRARVSRIIDISGNFQLMRFNCLDHFMKQDRVRLPPSCDRQRDHIVSFQITPRFSGSFRYSKIGDSGILTGI